MGRGAPHVLLGPCLLAGLSHASATPGSWSRTFPPWGEPDAPTAGAPVLAVPVVTPLTLHGCGASRYMSIRLAASHLNRRDATFCPAIANLRNLFEVQFTVEDSAANGVGALQGVIAQQGRGPLRVVLGPNGSGESQATSTYLSVFGVPQISWAATAASLSSKSVYPNFWRTVSPDSLVMRTLVRLLMWLGFTQCNVVYFDDVYTDGQRSDIAAASADLGFAPNPLRIPNSGEGGAAVSPASREVMMRVLDAVRRSACRVNVGLAINEQAWDLFKAVHDLGMLSEKGFCWFAGDGISGPQLAGLPERLPIFNGTMYVLANSRGASFDAYAARWAQDMPTTLTPEFDTFAWCKNGTQKAVCNHLPSNIFSSWVLGKHNVQLVCSSYEAMAYDAMVTLALVADRLISKKGGAAPSTFTEKDWAAEMLLLSKPANAFTCLSGLLSFNANQERDMPMNIYNWQADRGMLAAVVATWTGVDGFRWKVGQTVYWPAGDWGIATSEANISFVPTGRPPRCYAGSVYDTNSGTCTPCPAGQYTPAVVGDADATSCLLCPGGTFSSQAGQTECKQCPKGSRPRPDGASCALCEPGRVGASDGLAQCEACDAGSYAEAVGGTQCAFCPRGAYSVAKGSAACTACPEGLTTENIASQSQAMCACPEGTYYSAAVSSAAAGVCLACPEGLRCPLGLDAPTQRAGFYAEARGGDGGLAVFRCFSLRFCPGGPLGGCPTNRRGRACDFCAPGTYVLRDGTCADCSSSSSPIVQMVLVVAAVLAALTLLAWLTARGRSVVPSSLRNVDGCFNTVLLGVQCLSAMGGLDVKWTDPVSRIQGAMEVMQFSLDIVQPSCLFKVGGALAHYSISVAAVPFFIVYIIGVHYLVRMVLRHGSFNHLCNTVGRLAWMTYLPVALLAFAPLQCRENPTGESTVIKYRSMVCWEQGGGEHLRLVLIGVAAIVLLPLPFMSLTIVAAWMFPKALVSEGGVAFLRRFDFLFHHVRGHRYYFVIVIVLRAFVFALAPALITKSPNVHLIIMVAVLATYQFAQGGWQPWRSPVANFLDGCITLTLLVVAAVGCQLLGREDDVAVAALSASLLLSGVLSVTFIAIFSTQLVLPPKKFAAFLSHHKGGAAVLARLMKEVMSDHVHGKIFLDCDELDDLDLLVSCVAQGTKVFISICTRGYLSRMWCAIEVVAAVSFKVKTIAVVCDDFEDVTEEFLSGLPGLWTPRQWSEMEAHGCTLQGLRTAYEALAKARQVRFGRFGPIAQQLASIEEIVLASGLPRSMSSVLESRVHRIHDTDCSEILITGRVSDAESLCTCYVLQRFLQIALRTEVEVVREPRDIAAAPEAHFLIVLLHTGLLDSPSFAALLHAAAHLDPFPVTVGAFAFPGAEFYEALRAGALFPAQAAGPSLARVAELYEAMFQVLAANFTPHGSKAVLAAEVGVLVRRVSTMLPGRASRASKIALPDSCVKESNSLAKRAQHAIRADQIQVGKRLYSI